MLIQTLVVVILSCVLLLILAVILIIQLTRTDSCVICGEDISSKLVGFDTSSKEINTPSVRIQAQRLHKSDRRICKTCLEGLKLLRG